MNKGIGVLLMNLAVAGYLLAAGVLGLAEKSLKTALNKPEIRQAVEALFKKGDFADVLVAIISVLAIAAAVFIIIRLFDVSFPSIELILIILGIVWLVFIIMIDIVAPIQSKKDTSFIDWLRVFCPHLMVFAGIALSTERFGGR
jgi:hypothetical protein